MALLDSVSVRDGVKRITVERRPFFEYGNGSGLQVRGYLVSEGRLKFVWKLILGWGDRGTVIVEKFSTQLCF